MRGLLPVNVAQHDGAALLGQPSGNVGGYRAFATSAFAINDGDDGHVGINAFSKNKGAVCTANVAKPFHE
ncbi:MAG: hypothetical protein Q4G70_07995 [Pseudomonadota bacterium]|nr:hypothetical protein [Pseudomonadota bacterium]